MNGTSAKTQRLPRVLLACLGGLVLALLVAICTVTLLRLPKDGIDPGSRSEEFFEVRAKLNAAERDLAAEKAKVKNAETATREQKQRADAAAEEADGANKRLAAKDRELESIKSVLGKANDKTTWLQSRYYAMQGAKIHPADLKHEPTPDHTARVTEPEATGGAMHLALLNLTDVRMAGGFRRAPVLPRKEDPETGTAFYPSMRCDGFLAAPKALTKILRIEQADGKTLVVRHKGKGMAKLELLRCTLDPERDLLIMQARDTKMAADHPESIRFLVLEAASLSGKVVHQYQRECPTDEKKMQLMYRADGAASQVEAGFEYPWPEALAVQYGDLNEGKPFPLFSEARRLAISTRKPSMSTKSAETTASADADKRRRTIVLKRDVPDVAGRPLGLELVFDLPKGRGPRGVKVTLSARVLADYCGAIDAEEAREPWRAPLRRLAGLKAAEQKLFREGLRLQYLRAPLAKRLEATEKEKADAEQRRDRPKEMRARLEDLRNRVRKIDEELRTPVAKRDERKSDAVFQNEKTRLVTEGREIQKRMRSWERETQGASRKLKTIEQQIAQIKGALERKDGEIKAKRVEYDRKKKECADERSRLKALPEGLFKDVGSVEILDPWGRRLWAITPRLVRGKP